MPQLVLLPPPPLVPPPPPPLQPAPLMPPGTLLPPPPPPPLMLPPPPLTPPLPTPPLLPSLPPALPLPPLPLPPLPLPPPPPLSPPPPFTPPPAGLRSGRRSRRQRSPYVHWLLALLGLRRGSGRCWQCARAKGVLPRRLSPVPSSSTCCLPFVTSMPSPSVASMTPWLTALLTKHAARRPPLPGQSPYHPSWPRSCLQGSRQPRAQNACDPRRHRPHASGAGTTAANHNPPLNQPPAPPPVLRPLLTSPPPPCPLQLQQPPPPLPSSQSPQPPELRTLLWSPM